MPTTASRARALLTAAVLVLALAACGDDATADTDAVAEVPADTDAVAEVPADTLIEGLGRSILITLDGAQDWELDGDRLVVTMEGTSADNPSACLIVNGSRDGLGAPVSVSLEFDDTTVDCR